MPHPYRNREKIRMCSISDNKVKKLMKIAAIVFMILMFGPLPEASASSEPPSKERNPTWGSHLVDNDVIRDTPSKERNLWGPPHLENSLIRNPNQQYSLAWNPFEETDIFGDSPSYRGYPEEEDKEGWSSLVEEFDDTSSSPRRVRHHRAHASSERLSRRRRNQHEPLFEQDAYRSAIDENIEVGSSVLTVHATDQDLDSSGIIEYQLRNTDHFRIDQGGVIYTTKHLDYESTGGAYRFGVVARNPYSDSEGTTADVTLRINDQPDAPVFDSEIYYFNISEFADTGNYVGTIVARDSDNDFDYYSLQDVVPEGLFVIDPRNGIITVGTREGATDYVYDFLAVATDKMNHSSSVPVKVNIIDENTNKPIFEDCSTYNNRNVSENGSVPEIILTVVATDADYGKNGQVQYSLLTEDPKFSIDAVSGDLTVKESLDRDRGEKSHFLTVIARDMAEDPLQNSCSFNIVVLDINDNAPIFDQEKYSQNVPSDTVVDVTILRLTATDMDAGRNAEIKYSLEGGSDEDREYFVIDQNTGAISLKKSLENMEIGRRFNLSAMARDNPGPGITHLSSTVPVQFQVVSPGRMPPSVESQEPDEAIISEDATQGTNIVTICAKSNSESEEVYMDMINGNQPESNSEGTFDIRTERIDATCPSGTQGHVYLATANLDYEEIQSYTLIIQLGNDYGRSEYSLSVTVVDKNDNPPVLQKPYTASISENVDRTMVMQVKAVDRDASPEFRQLRYSFKDPQPVVTENFRIDSVSGEIWTLQPLDREQMRQYRLPIQVADGVNVRDRQYWIIVNDQNDEPPRFNRDHVDGVYETSIEEDLTPSKDTGIVLIVEDEDILNEFSYQIISGNEKNKFKIDAQTGVISVNEDLDYDRIPDPDRNFTMEVRVSDGKSYDTTEVKITVLNTNDLAPVFDPQEYSASVTENVDCDKSIAQVEAVDPDYPTNSDILYYLNPNDQSNFTVDPNTGIIYVKGCLDREATHPLGTLVIYPVAYDEGGIGKNSAPATVNITVEDINDNHPYIQSPPDMYHQFTENLPPETQSTSLLIQLADQDDPSKSNGCPCTLAFDESTPPEVIENFSLTKVEDEENRYELKTTRELDREAQKFYEIPLRTSDYRNLSGIRTLTIEVGDQNDSPMTDGESQINVYNYRSSFPDIVIGSVYVTDADDYDVVDKTFTIDSTETADDALQYFIVNDNGNITMKMGTPGGDYTLIVKVKDYVRSERAVGTVHIKVVDLPKEAVMQSGSFIIQSYTSAEVITQQDSSTFEGTSLYDKLRVELGEIFGTPSENVDIFSLRDVQRNDQTGVEVRLNLYGSPYYTASHVNGILMQNKQKVEADLQITILAIDDNLCIYEEKMENYEGTGCQQELRADDRVPLVIESGTSTMVGVNVTAKYSYKCGALDPLPKACPDGFCLNGGTCEFTNSILRCNCPNEYDYGPRCELLTARFQKGFAWFDSVGTCEEPTLQVSFQSDEPSAILIYNGPIVAWSNLLYPEDFLYLVLNKWIVEAYLNLGSGTSHVSVPVNQSTDTAYDVYLSWTKNTITLKIPNCGKNTTQASEACTNTEVIPTSTTSILNAGGPLQVGGLAPGVNLKEMEDFYKWNYDLPEVERFSGCILTLKYNNEIYDLNRTTYNENFTPECNELAGYKSVKMSNESVFIIVGSLLILLLLVLLVLCLMRRRKKPHSYPDHLNEIVKETIGTTDIEGYGEKDMTQFDLKLLRVSTGGKIPNGHQPNGDLPDVTKRPQPPKAPLARLSEGFSIDDFIGDNIKKVDKGHPDFDDVRHYCYEGDEMSIASLSSLGSGSEGDEPPYDYKEDWGPRFKRLAEIYGPKPDEEEDSDYEFPIPKKPPKQGSSSLPKNTQMTPSSGASSVGSLNTQDGNEPTTVPYMRLGQQPKSPGEDDMANQRSPPPVVVRGEYHEAVNPLAGGKESWC